MALPKKLKIGSQTYSVTQVKNPKSINGDSVFAEHNYQTLSIKVDKDLNERLKELYLVHEVLHGLFQSQEINLEGDREEYVVTNLTHGITSFIKDNPTFIKQLMRK